MEDRLEGWAVRLKKRTTAAAFLRSAIFLVIYDNSPRMATAVEAVETSLGRDADRSCMIITTVCLYYVTSAICIY